MEYRKLGNTDLELSAITYGAFAIGGNMWGGNEKKDSIASVRASIDNGVTTLDTAPFYGFGLSEEMIGEAIKGYDRSKIQLLTKFGLVWDGSNQEKEFFFDAEEAGKTIPVYKYASKASVIKEVEDSLKRLQTDYIDLLQIHWPDATT
jgi:aryl-alcohol dehydrogenase-like predicted oxidoreductase